MTRLTRPELPIDRRIPDVLESLRMFPNVLVEAEPGSGKTTRIPPALLEFGGDVLVLEPRRIAARMAARRVAFELGERPGETVGYQVRFEDVSGPQTRLRFLTEGVLTRRLLTDSQLAGVGVVVLDEFHERHLETDLALALLRRLQKTSRPDLRLAVMSATLEKRGLAEFLGRCPVIRAEGRSHPIEITHVPYSPAPLEQQVASALGRLLDSASGGDILVFLPGSAEIRKAARACESLAARHHLLLTPLSGDLSTEEQDRALAPADRRKVILSTNIAESSVTIEGVTAVIDSGLARIPHDSPWTGLPALEVARVSKASAVQRAGRAGRSAPGKVIRLYTAEDFQRRSDHELPEIVRRELSQLCLHLAGMGVTPESLEWLEAPPAAALESARALLVRLEARGAVAARMSRMPLHPRLSRLVVSGIERGAGERACAAAALMSSGERVTQQDVLRALDGPRGPRTQQLYEQIRRIARPPPAAEASPDSLALAILSGFPDRVGRRLVDNTYQMSGGRMNGGMSATVAETAGAFIVAIDIEQRSDRPAPVIRLACDIQPEWLLDLFPDYIQERRGLEWNRNAERIEEVSALLYDDLVIEQSCRPAPPSVDADRLLLEKVLDAGLDRFVERTALDAFMARAEFAAMHSSIKRLDEADVMDAFSRLIAGKNSFAQVRAASPQLIPELERGVYRDMDRHEMSNIAPLRYTLPNGRQTRIHYEQGKTPWMASRLQDFFGLRESPRVGRGQVPVVIHLLAPNQRPVQTTTDLDGFWRRLYPAIRRELSRRYPKHAWPEKPY